MAKVPNGIGTLPKISTGLSRVHERYRRQTDIQTTDGQVIAYSERDREFTFAKNDHKLYSVHLYLYISQITSLVKGKTILYTDFMLLCVCISKNCSCCYY